MLGKVDVKPQCIRFNILKDLFDLLDGSTTGM